MFNDPKTKHLYAFEREVNRLITEAGDSPADFFGRHRSMISAKWTIAHFSYGQGKTPEQGAADWFAECCAPKIK